MYNTPYSMINAYNLAYPINGGLIMSPVIRPRDSPIKGPRYDMPQVVGHLPLPLAALFGKSDPFSKEAKWMIGPNGTMLRVLNFDKKGDL